MYSIVRRQDRNGGRVGAYYTTNTTVCLYKISNNNHSQKQHMLLTSLCATTRRGQNQRLLHHRETVPPVSYKQKVFVFATFSFFRCCCVLFCSTIFIVLQGGKNECVTKNLVLRKKEQNGTKGDKGVPSPAKNKHRPRTHKRELRCCCRQTLRNSKNKNMEKYLAKLQFTH